MGKKSKVHPNYHDVKVSVIHKDGRKETFKCRSTFNGDELVSEVDLSKHVAWANKPVEVTDGMRPATRRFNRRMSMRK